MLETSNGNLALHETFRNRLVYNQRFIKMSVVTLLLSPSLGRGTPEGQGVGRRRNSAKPTSGATRHLLPEEGGRNRNKCSALYTSSLKACYSYSLFMNLHNLILRLNQRFPISSGWPEASWQHCHRLRSSLPDIYRRYPSRTASSLPLLYDI